MKKKIIIISPAFPLRGGIVDSAHALAYALEDIGHNVQILSFSLQYPSFLFPGKTQYDHHGSKPHLNIVTHINSINPISWIRCAFWLRKQRPDIVITRYWIPYIGLCLGTILRFSGLKKHISLVALCDNVIPHEKRIGDHFLTKYFLNANNKFFVMSKSVGTDISTFVNNAIVDYHPHPVYNQFGDILDKKLSIKSIGLDESKKYILFFGFIRKYKGLDLLLDAMTLVNDGVELIVAGEFYEEEEEYRRIVKKNRLEHLVHFFSDFIPHNQVNIYFSACDMVVQPYRTATQSGVAQIAYHFNKPILVTNVGGLPEIVPHNKVGYVVDVDAHAIADAVNDFYIHDREAFFIDNVKNEKEKYSWKSMAEQISLH